MRHAGSPGRVVLLAAALAAGAGCATPSPESPAPAAAPPAAAGAPESARIDLRIRGEPLVLEIRVLEVVEGGPSAPRAVRCILRLLGEDGGYASHARREAEVRSLRPGDAREEVLRSGEAAPFLFRRASDGMFRRVVLVPEVRDSRRVEWTVKEANLI